MKRKFYTSYVYDSWNGEKLFNNAIVFIESNIESNNEKQIPILLQQKLSNKINDNATGRFFPVTLINFWEID